MVTSPNSYTEFLLSFEGDALAEHTMDVQDLAPALLGFSQAFERANTILNGERTVVSLTIKATRPGSFELWLMLVQLYREATEFLTGDFVTSAANLKALFIGGGSTAGTLGLFALIKRLKGKKPESVDEEGSAITIQADNLRVNVHRDVVRLLSDPLIRSNVSNLVRPLNRDGIDRVVFKEDNQEIEAIEKDDAGYFNALQEYDENVTQTIIPRMRLRPIRPVFNKSGKWQLNDGEKSRWYYIADQEFIESVEAGRRFGSRDYLVCEVMVTQRSDPQSGKLNLEHTILRVIDHLNPGDQLTLSE